MMEHLELGAKATPARADRGLWNAMARGFRNRCPHCGEGRIFSSSFLATETSCAVCSEAFHHHRADDLPAYLVIFIVGHIVVGAFMGVERAVALSLWQHLAIWGPVTVLLSIALLRPVKGAIVGLQWALYMHGFGGHEDALESHPEV